MQTVLTECMKKRKAFQMNETPYPEYGQRY